MTKTQSLPTKQKSQERLGPRDRLKALYEECIDKQSTMTELYIDVTSLDTEYTVVLPNTTVKYTTHEVSNLRLYCILQDPWDECKLYIGSGGDLSDWLFTRTDLNVYRMRYYASKDPKITTTIHSDPKITTTIDSDSTTIGLSSIPVDTMLEIVFAIGNVTYAYSITFGAGGLLVMGSKQSSKTKPLLKSPQSVEANARREIMETSQVLVDESVARSAELHFEYIMEVVVSEHEPNIKVPMYIVQPNTVVTYNTTNNMNNLSLFCVLRQPKDTCEMMIETEKYVFTRTGKHDYELTHAKGLEYDTNWCIQPIVSTTGVSNLYFGDRIVIDRGDGSMLMFVVLVSSVHCTRTYTTSSDIVTTVLLIPDTVTSKSVDEVSGGGDPYLYPLIGPAMKLPNVEQVYRLYQDAGVVVNARVTRASQRIRAEIESLVQHVGLQATASEAYFFSELWLGSRHDPADYVHVDLEQKKVSSGSTATFRVEAATVDWVPCKYDTTTRSHVSIPIYWKKPRVGDGTAAVGDDDMCLMVSFSRNPQVRNGLRLSGMNLREGTGLLIRNYRARFFQLLRLDCRMAVELPRNCRRVTTQRGTSGYREHVLMYTLYSNNHD